MKIEKNMKMERIKRGRIMFSLLLTVSLFFSGLSLGFADTDNIPKEETVYSTLFENGGVNEIFVVNGFSLSEDREIEDYGDYSAVRELTQKTKIYKEGDRLTIEGKKGKFHYEGTLKSKDLPWLIDIKYFLDGKERTVKELEGKSGHLKINLKTGKNPKVKGGFFESYTLQVMFTYDPEKTENVAGKGATFLNSGTKKQALFTVMPGKAGNITLSLDVKDFEMEGILINGIHMDMDFDVDIDSEMQEKIDELKDGVIELDDGVIELEDGIIEFKDGTEELRDGVFDLRKGIRDFDKGVGELSKGLKELNKNSESLVSGAGTIFLNTLTQVHSQLSEGGISLPPLTGSNYEAVLDGVISGARQVAIDAALKTVEDSIRSTITTSYGAFMTPEQIEDEVVSQMEAFKESPGYEALVSGVDAVLATDLAYQGMKASLTEAKTQLKGLDDFRKGVGEYTKGVSEIAKGAVKLEDGSFELKDGIYELYDGTIDLYDGAIELMDGIIEMADGTKEFREKTHNLEGDMKDMIKKRVDKMLGRNIKTSSFVSDKNKNTELVQFIIKTDEIKIPEIEMEKELEKKELTLFEKIKRLFMKMIKRG